MTVARWLYCDYSHSELIVFQTRPQPVQHLANINDMGIFVTLLLNLVMISLRII